MIASASVYYQRYVTRSLTFILSFEIIRLQEETDVYIIHWFGDIVAAGIGFREVRFIDYSRHGIPLPNPKFIAIQAAIAHVLLLSGAGEIIDAVIDRFFQGGVVPAGRITDDDDMALRMSLLDIDPLQYSHSVMIF